MATLCYLALSRRHTAVRHHGTVLISNCWSRKLSTFEFRVQHGFGDSILAASSFAPHPWSDVIPIVGCLHSQVPCGITQGQIRPCENRKTNRSTLGQNKNENVKTRQTCPGNQLRAWKFLSRNGAGWPVAGPCPHRPRRPLFSAWRIIGVTHEVSGLG